MIAGESLGVGDDIRREWQESMPDTWHAMEKRTPELPSVSGRWTGEMREIAQTYESLGLTSSFHEGAEWIYELLSQTALADESREEARERSRSVKETLAQFVRTLDDRG